MNVRRTLFSLFLIAALVPALLTAQTQGEVTGQITDTTGGLIAGARITVTNEGTNAVRIVNTNNSGVYNIPSLTPGLYTVKVEAQGFQSAVRSAVELQVQQTARIDFQLQRGRPAIDHRKRHGRIGDRK